MGLQLLESRSSSIGVQSMDFDMGSNGLQIQAVNGQGLGVFARRSYEKDQAILVFGGIETHSQHISDVTHYLQISPELYLSPTGQLDDYVNHSCVPNSAAFFQNDTLVLKSIEHIKAGDQVSFDYGTIMFNESTKFECACGTNVCRKEIGNFYSMPVELQNSYLDKGMVPLLTKYTKEQLGF